MMRSFAKRTREPLSRVLLEEAVRHQTVVFVNPPIDFYVFHLGFMRMGTPLPIPEHRPRFLRNGCRKPPPPAGSRARALALLSFVSPQPATASKPTNPYPASHPLFLQEPAFITRQRHAADQREMAAAGAFHDCRA